MSRLQDRYKVILFMLGGLLLGALLGVLVFINHSDTIFHGERNLPPTVGSPAPDFELHTGDGQSIKIANLKGRAVVINFWATWCGPCREEMPLFQKYAQEQENRLTFLGVNEQEGLEQVGQFTRDLGIQFPILFDLDGSVAGRYYVRSFPATFFVDSDGVLRAQHLGQMNEDLLVQYLATIGIKP